MDNVPFEFLMKKLRIGSGCTLHTVAEAFSLAAVHQRHTPRSIILRLLHIRLDAQKTCSFWHETSERSQPSPICEFPEKCDVAFQCAFGHASYCQLLFSINYFSWNFEYRERYFSWMNQGLSQGEYHYLSRMDQAFITIIVYYQLQKIDWILKSFIS